MTFAPFQPKPIPQGSSLYYALLYCSDKEREAVSILFSFFEELKGIVDKVSEAQVAKVKLLWWSQEITKIYHQKQQHPLSQRLAPIIESYQLPENEFQHFIKGMVSDIDHHGFSSNEELENYCRNMGGAKCNLWSHIVAGKANYNETFSSNIGIALELLEQIQHPAPSESENLLKEHAKLARDYYNKALQSLDNAHRYAQLSLLIYAKLKLALLDEVERDNFQVLKHKVSLTPLRKFWIAWRTRSFERKYLNR